MRFQKLFILVADLFCGIQSEKGIPSNTKKKIRNVVDIQNERNIKIKIRIRNIKIS